MAYMALPQEVQTTRIIEEARRQQKRVVVPLIERDQLIAVELPLDHTRLRRGRFGILEPCDATMRVPPEDIDCVLIPGVAFDHKGRRLGFGKGYYDRFLEQLSTTTCLCGLAFCVQIVPCVPQMPHDICMHILMTEQGLIPCRRALPSQTS
jgi:5-formyltetrahydrofolate cyclo-ligase